MRHFKTVENAEKRIRVLEERLAWYEQHCRNNDAAILMLAKLSSKAPMFFNPIEAMAAEAVRDTVLESKGLITNERTKRDEVG